MAITINRTTSLDGAILPEYMPGLLYMNENQAHKFVITCTRGGSAVTLTGGITGRFMRADGQTILLSGSISSGKANLTLPQSCYIVPGRFTMAIFNVVGNAVTTIYALTGNVARTQTDTLVDPGNTVPTIDNLLAEIDAMRQATADANAAATKAVRYDTTQSLTDANKTTARGNIDAAGLAQVVRHDASQNLTETQKNTARGNIDAAGLAQVVRHDASQNLTETQKNTARGNIDVPSFAQALTSSGMTFVRETAESQADDGVYRDLDTVPKNTIVTYYISGTASIDHIPVLGYNGFQATVITLAQNGTNSSDIGVVQMCVDAVTNNVYMRINWTSQSTWSSWFNPYNTDIADQIGFMKKYSTRTNTIVLRKTGSVIRQGVPIYIRGDFISEDVHVDSTFAYMTLYGVYGKQESGGYDVFGQYLGFSGDVMEITPINDYHHINVFLNNFNKMPSGTTWGISANIDQTDGASILSTIAHAPWDNGLLKPYNTDVELNKLFGLSGNSGDVLTVRYTSKKNIASNSVTVFGMYGPIQRDGFDNLGTVDYGAVRQFTLQRDYAGFQIYAPGVGAGASYCVSAAVNLINGVQKDVIRIDQHSARSFNLRTCNIFHKVVCVGDSYTSGHIQTPSESTATGTNEDYAWPRFMEQLTGGNTYVNCGISGATTVTWQTGARGLAKAQASGRAQAYIIGLMINDSEASSAKYVPVGTATDIGTNNNTYYAQMSKIVRELNTVSPQAKIFINTCPKSDTARYAPYNQAVRDIVEYYEDTYPVHCIDLVEYADLYAMQSLVDDFTNDHYTALGYEQFAEIYAYILSDYINNHVSEFQDVYKIPYDMPE